MAMRTKLILIACLISSTLLGQEIEKQYFLHGVDDSLRYSIDIQEDVINEITTFSTQEYALKIFKVQDIENVTVYANTFLQIQFRVRGGSGIKLRKNVLLCVSRGKIFKALDILSNVSSVVPEVYDKVADSLKLFDEREDYHVTVSIKQKGNYYKAVLSESKKVELKYNPSQNESFEKSYELDFDPGGYFFYNSMKRLNKRYKVNSSKDNQVSEKVFSEKVPCMQLYQTAYLLIDGEWFLDNGNDSLSCL